MIMGSGDGEFKTNYEDMPVPGLATQRRLRTTKKNFGKNAYKKFGKKGGSTPTKKLKGLAALKRDNPEKFNEIREKRYKK